MLYGNGIENLEVWAGFRKNKNIRGTHRGMNELKKGYQHRINSLKDENRDFLAGYHNILNK
jgi:hypothetical protein